MSIFRTIIKFLRVLYAGTHDNDTIMGFMDSVQDYQRDQILEYLDADKVSDVPKKMIRSGYASIAVTVIIQMQDILELDTSARINTPATLGGNWCWRMKKEQLKDEDAHRLVKMVRAYGR